MEFRQRQYAVALEAVHELVRHHAVRAQEVGAVEAARDGVRVAALAPGAAQVRRAVDSRRLEHVTHGEVRQQAGDARRRQIRLCPASGARDLVGRFEDLLEARLAECVEAGQYFGNGISVVAQAAFCVRRAFGIALGRIRRRARRRVARRRRRRLHLAGAAVVARRRHGDDRRR